MTLRIICRIVGHKARCACGSKFPYPHWDVFLPSGVNGPFCTGEWSCMRCGVQFQPLRPNLVMPETARGTYEKYLSGEITLEEAEHRMQEWSARRTR